ncbi:hypothetical protein KDI_01360 [Dictyobacter arantiisoli]|uniref:Uncharacterized protein n=1 Tax=Dictyobacter arantiisoli TaxID=2014874 RepID=A0A5A5T5F5_9CHLR|nr:hypothetical protein KDI_01360 [Dictyobacter arantiisoli]
MEVCELPDPQDRFHYHPDDKTAQENIPKQKILSEKRLHVPHPTSLSSFVQREGNLQLVEEVYQMESAFSRNIYTNAHA